MSTERELQGRIYELESQIEGLGDTINELREELGSAKQERDDANEELDVNHSEYESLYNEFNNCKWALKQLMDKDYLIQYHPVFNQQKVVEFIAYMIAIANGIYPYFHENLDIFPYPNNVKFTREQFEELNNSVADNPLLTGVIFEWRVEELTRSRTLYTPLLKYIWLTHGFNNPTSNVGDISKWNKTLDNFRNHEMASWERFTHNPPNNNYPYNLNEIIRLSKFLV